MNTIKDGEKMIQVVLRFWTNNIAEKDGDIVPGHAWDGGMVTIPKNESHKIKSSRGVPFHSLTQISYCVEKALTKAGIKIHNS